MRTYELVLVLKSDLKDTDRKKLTDLVKTWLKSVKVTKEDDWGKKSLAYPIKHEVSGYYLDYILEGDTFPTDFEKRLMTQENMLRHLLLRSK